ncbi:MAG: TldD/PmbA family protein [archaeon]
MSHELAEFAIKHAVSLGASYAEARLEQVDADAFVAKNGVLEVSGFDTTLGLGIRFIANNTLGFVSTNIIDKGKIKHLVEKAIKLTSCSSKITDGVSLSAEPVEKAKYGVKQKKGVLDIGPAEKIALLKDIESNLAETKIKMPGRYLSLSTDITKKYYTNSEGSVIESEIPRINFYYMLTVLRGKKTAQRMWQYGSANGWEIIDAWNLPHLLKNEAVAIEKNLRVGVKPPRGVMDMVVGPEIAGIIAHESCGHPFEADRILGREAAQAGESYMTLDMIGKRFANPCVTVVDDPTVQNAFGFYLYDDEGVKARRKFLVKGGVVTELLQNRETAASLKAHSNGAARASEFDKEAIVRMSNTFFLPGEYKTEQELIEGVKLGVYIKNFMEWNIDDKRYNNRYVGAEAYLIENGKITVPVRNPAIEVTTPALYNSIDACAQNLEFHSASCGKGEPMQGIPVTMGGPSLRLRGLKLGR